MIAGRRAGMPVWGMISRRIFVAALPAVAFAGAAWADPAFEAFLRGVRADAIAAGIRAATVDRAFAGLQPNPKVLELDSHPAERTQSWVRYRSTRLSEQRVQAGRQAMQANAVQLAEVARRYGVDPGVIVAIWGLETNFGGFTGGFSVIEALATLAADGRRDGFFRAELISALRILDHGDISLGRMTGSYAGAMGQPQFMPSSYLDYAVDYDGKGRRDIWDSRADTLASIGNYLAKFGWRAGEPWCQAIRVPPGLDTGPEGRDDRRPLSAWTRLGVRRADGTAFPASDIASAVVMPDGPGGEAFMTYANFGVIRLYNHSDLYALSVGLLALEISARRTVL